jgi:glycosyltransferase involved in cell wall biosynthesis
MSIANSGVVIVMPYLNEAVTLERACLSLGFGGAGRAGLQGHRLILVDNGSSDQSLAIASGVQRSCLPGAVVLVREKERGHVPARAAGIVAASMQERCQFIVQADADTTYETNYVDALWAAAKHYGPGVLIDACMEWPLEAKSVDAGFRLAVDLFDANLPVSCAPDVVVDDKACGFWLTDYVSWGEHFREFWSTGEEMLAETTRLYIRGRYAGATRQMAKGAIARHSVRNWVKHPSLEIASGGFPMPASWKSTWLDAKLTSLLNSNEAVYTGSLPFRMRRRMLQAMFVALPDLVEENRPVDRSKSNAALTAAELVEVSFRAAGTFELLSLLRGE